MAATDYRKLNILEPSVYNTDPPGRGEVLSAELARLQAENARLREEIDFAHQIIAGLDKPRLVTVHICATENGVSATYPEGANVGDVVGKLWAYIRRARERDPEFRLPRPIRGPY